MIAQISYEYAPKKRHNRKRDRSRVVPAEYLEHCEILAEMLHKLAIVYNRPAEEISALTVYRCLKRYGFACVRTGVQHSPETPLTLRFTAPLEFGGDIRPDNFRPFYDPTLQPGEYRIKRTSHRYVRGGAA